MFSKGFIWFYWDYHKNGGNRAALLQDYGGYTEQQLYVACKYTTFKNEILEHLDKETYDLVMTKSEQYLNTHQVKSMTPNTLVEMGILNYGISDNDAMKLDHIISVVLYCDYSAYCTKFSSTFRKLFPAESMEEVKVRNSEFWHQSKSFREVVECFGSIRADETDAAGPFFTGIDVVLAVPAFAISLCSPTSTSKHMEVSMNFTNGSGMIIQLNNPDSDFRARLVPLLDVSWISRYPDEDERSFTGLSRCLFICLSFIYSNYALIIHNFSFRRSISNAN